MFAIQFFFGFLYRTYQKSDSVIYLYYSLIFTLEILFILSFNGNCKPSKECGKNEQKINSIIVLIEGVLAAL